MRPDRRTHISANPAEQPRRALLGRRTASAQMFYHGAARCTSDHSGADLASLSGSDSPDDALLAAPRSASGRTSTASMRADFACNSIAQGFSESAGGASSGARALLEPTPLCMRLIECANRSAPDGYHVPGRDVPAKKRWRDGGAAGAASRCLIPGPHGPHGDESPAASCQSCQ